MEIKTSNRSKRAGEKYYQHKKQRNIDAGLTCDGKPRHQNLSEEEKKQRRREYSKRQHERRMKDPMYRLRYNINRKKRRASLTPTYATLQERIIQSIKGRLKDFMIRKTCYTIDIIGCSAKELVEHLQAQFIGCMSWNNYGKAWHIDHIVPCSYFDLTKPEEVMRCFHFTNLRPLWAKRNMREKDDRGDAQPSLCI